MRVPRFLEGWMGSGTVLILLGATCFSVKSIFIKLAYRYGVDAATLLTLRMSLALPFFLVVAAMKWRGTDQAAVAPRDWAGVFVMGLLGYYFASYLDFLGLQYVSAGLERLILFLYPTFVMLLSARVTGTQITRREVLATALSYAGIAMAVYADLWLQQPAVLLGSGLVLASVLPLRGAPPDAKLLASRKVIGVPVGSGTAVGVTVALGLPMKPERHGFDYDDAAAVAAQNLSMIEQPPGPEQGQQGTHQP